MKACACGHGAVDHDMWGSGPCTKDCGCARFRAPGAEPLELEKLRIEQGNPLTDRERVERLREKLSHLDKELTVLREGLAKLHRDAERWLTESDDRPNLRAAASRIGKLLALKDPS